MLKMEHTIALTNHANRLLISVAYFSFAKKVKFNVHYLVGSGYPFQVMECVFEKIYGDIWYKSH